MKQILPVVLASLLLAIAAEARQASVKINPRTPAAVKTISRDVPDNLPPYIPGATDETDEVILIGTSYTDHMNHGGMCRTITADDSGRINVAWMNARATNNGDRIVSYNFRESSYGWFNTTGTPVFTSTGAGFPVTGVLPDGRAVVVAHRPTGIYPRTTVIAVDDERQIGAFAEHAIPPTAQAPYNEVIWPSMAIGADRRVNVFSTESLDPNPNPYDRIMYSRSDTAGNNPAVFAPAVRTCGFGSTVAASRTTNRVVMAWGETLVPNGYTSLRGWNGYLASQLNNELMLAESTDGGANWNFNSPFNVTRTRIWNDTVFAATGDTVLAAGDSLRFFNDASMIFDNQNHLHIVFTTRGLWEDGTIDTTTAGPPIVGLTGSACYLWHWTETRPNAFDLVADGWWTVKMMGWRSTIDRPSLAIAPNNDLYCVFTRYAYRDTSANGWPCGDVWATVSTNNGNDWYHPTNLTNTPGNGAVSGQAHNECWAQVAERVVRDSLYINYLDDRSGGSAWQETELGTDWTLNQEYVKIVRTTAVRRDSLILDSDYPPLRNFSVSAPEPVSNRVPDRFRLRGNFPNPFNPSTEIEYTVDRTRDVTLSVYDISGRLVKQLVNSRLQPGTYRSVFDARNLASGIYFARLASGGNVKTSKLTFMK